MNIQNEILPKIPPKFIGIGECAGLFNRGITAWAGEQGISFAPNLTPDKETGIGN